MMSEIKQIEEVIKPTETILVADSLTGQVAANVAKEFGNTVKLTGIILTRADGDGRFIEKLGYFNPLLPKDKKDRVGLEKKDNFH